MVARGLALSRGRLVSVRARALVRREDSARGCFVRVTAVPINILRALSWAVVWEARIRFLPPPASLRVEARHQPLALGELDLPAEPPSFLWQGPRIPCRYPPMGF